MFKASTTFRLNSLLFSIYGKSYSPDRGNVAKRQKGLQGCHEVTEGAKEINNPSAFDFVKSTSLYTRKGLWSLLH